MRPLPNLSPQAVALAPSAGILAPLSAVAPAIPDILTPAEFVPAPELLVAVFPSKFVKGCDTLVAGAQGTMQLPLRAALETRYPNDAHFHCYGLSHGGVQADCRGNGMPRFNKLALPSVRASRYDLETFLLTLDYDNHAPDGTKKPWAGEELNAFLEVVLTQEGPLGQFACVYSTKNGARLVYRLDKGIPVEKAEHKIAGLISLWGTKGLTFDSACIDWTRFFRAPFVVRDGIPQNPEVFEFFDGVTISADDIPGDSRMEKFSKEKKGRTLPPARNERPTTVQCQGFVQLDKDGKKEETAWMRDAKKALKGTKWYPFCFESIGLVQPHDSNWDNSLTGLVGGVVGILSKAKHATAEAVYAIVLPVAEHMQGLDENQASDWSESAWSKVQRFWANAIVSEEATLIQEQAQVAKALAMEETIVEGVRSWDAEMQAADYDTVLQYAREHFIVGCGDEYFVMQADGHYSDNSIPSSALIHDLMRSGMDKFLGLTKFDRTSGEMRFVSVSELLGKFGRSVKGICAEPGKVGGTLSKGSRDNRVLYINSYRLSTKLQAAYDAEVAEWLRLLAGNEKAHTDLLKWLAYAPDFINRPTCALSLAGEPGCGKGMLKDAIKQLLDTPALAGPEDLIGKYQYGLNNSPFLVIDEAFPIGEGHRHPADSFRSLVSGNEMTIELKFKAPVSLKAYPRVIMLANNIDSIVGKLIEGRNLTQQDREALEIRLMHIPVPKDAQQWLADKGGYLFTKDPEGKRGHWVDGTDPKKDFRIARHILWLYENREKNPPGRFLVQGNRHPDVLYKMQSESGNTGIVIDALVDMIESGLNRPTFRVVEGKAYYMISSVQDAVRELAIKRRERITGKQVTECMKGLTLPHDGREIVLPGAEELGPREWLIVDARLLLAVAKKEGKAYKILSTLEGAR